MIVVIGSDHAGFEYKQLLIAYLINKGIEVGDEGTYSNSSSDYSDFAFKVSKKVVEKKANFGILICGTGIGMSIAANKVNGIRAALICSEFTAESAKSHNHANVITFGSRVSTIDEIKTFINIFMKTENSIAKRHIIRVNKTMELEEKKWEK